MILKSIRIQNFRSYLDAEVKFPPSGTVLIRGRDVTTGESSGTGKSAIFLAIAYALDILPTGLSAKSLQSWANAGDLQVTLSLSVNGTDYVLNRGKKTSIAKDGTVIATGAAAYAEELGKLLGGIPPLVLRSLTYRPQRENGFFLSMGPSEKIEFLSEILGLSAIERAIEQAEKTIKEFDVQVKTADVGIETYTNALALVGAAPVKPTEDIATLQETKGHLEKDLQEAAKAEAAAKQRLEASIADQRAEIHAKTEELNAAYNKAREFEAQLEAADAKKRIEAEEHNNKVNIEIARITRTIDKIRHQQTEISTLEGQLLSLQKAECHTCHRQWDLSAQEAVKVAEKLALLKREAELLPQLNTELSSCHGSKVTVYPDPKIRVCREIADNLSKERLKVASTPLRYPPELEKEYEERRLYVARVTESKRELETKMTLAKAALEAYRKQVDAHVLRVTQNTQQLEDWKAKKAKALEVLNAEKDFVAAMGRGGFLGRIVSDVLTEIELEATRWLGRMANVNRVSLSFSTETEKGKQKIQTWVDVRGNRGKPEAVLSGGQLASVEQAVDLAVMNVISRRRGALVPQWLCLDEVFNGLGQVSKESAFEILREIGKNRLVMVIDHGSEFKEAFDQTIDVEFDNGTSKIL